MRDAVAHPPHDEPVVAEEPVSLLGVEACQNLDARRESHTHRVDDYLVIDVPVGRVCAQELKVCESVAQDLLVRAAHNWMASASTRRLNSGRSALSGTRSTCVPTSSLIWRSSRPMAMSPIGLPAVNNVRTGCDRPENSNVVPASLPNDLSDGGAVASEGSCALTGPVEVQ